ncbi:MAG: Unknown protein [uncultured Sulfurovum sp.]|uniref:Uncharacterized protein n=1 Tax=uncultured Sulfurovum sp. TaxID=269237 RepID=A0A6S6UA21_9BACT|nr:MAG: Unknown protein [uncultured Sulfurovum sp.]
MHLIFATLCLSTLLLNGGGGVLDVNWSTIQKTQQKSMAAYPKVLVDGIKKVKFPVYLSSNYAYNKEMSVVADKYFYAISFNLDKAMVLFEGDRTFQESVDANSPEFKKIIEKLKPVEFSQSEGVRIASYQRHGVNYSISVECEQPDKDKRCTEETFVKALYSSIIMTGGQP